ncbi:hypothetical protein P7C73_g6720, partial [Tremellales sp. Uapishka_1]
MLLPPRRITNPLLTHNPNLSADHTISLYHPSTFIHSAPSADNPLSPASGETSTDGYVDPIGLTPSGAQHDAFQLYVTGDLPSDRTLVGDGQKLTPQVIELIQKADAKLRKHFSLLLREGDALARRVLDEELAALTGSLSTGNPLPFDFMAAMTGSGLGWDDERDYGTA